MRTTAPSTTAVVLSFALLASSLWPAQPAAAEAKVDVVLRNKAGEPVEGRVLLETEDGKAVASCQTVEGRCTMASVPGGSYRVRVEPKQGKAPKPTHAMIPPNGEVTLHVSSGS